MEDASRTDQTSHILLDDEINSTDNKFTSLKLSKNAGIIEYTRLTEPELSESEQEVNGIDTFKTSTSLTDGNNESEYKSEFEFSDSLSSGISYDKESGPNGYISCGESIDTSVEKLRAELEAQKLLVSNLNRVIQHKEGEINSLRTQLYEWTKASEARSFEIIKHLTDIQTADKAKLDFEQLGKNSANKDALFDVQLLINEFTNLKQQYKTQQEEKMSLKNDMKKIEDDCFNKVTTLAMKLSDSEANNRLTVKSLKRSRVELEKKKMENKEELIFLSDEVIQFKKHNSKLEQNNSHLRNELAASKTEKQTLIEKHSIQIGNLSKALKDAEGAQQKLAIDLQNATAQKEACEDLMIKAEEEFKTYVTRIRQEHESELEKLESHANLETERLLRETEKLQVMNSVLRSENQSLEQNQLESKQSSRDLRAVAIQTDTSAIKDMKSEEDHIQLLKDERRVLKNRLSKMKTKYEEYFNLYEDKIKQITFENLNAKESVEQRYRSNLGELQQEINALKTKVASKPQRDKVKCNDCQQLKQQFKKLRDTVRTNLLFQSPSTKSEVQHVLETSRSSDLETLGQMDVEIMNGVEKLKLEFVNIKAELENLKTSKNDSVTSEVQSQFRKSSKAKKLILAIYDYLEKHKNDGLSTEALERITRRIRSNLQEGSNGNSSR